MESGLLSPRISPRVSTAGKQIYNLGNEVTDMIFTTELDQYAMTCNLNLEKISRQFDREFQPIVYESEAPYLEAGLMEPVQKFFTNLVNTLKNFVRQIQESVQATIRTKNIKRQLRAFHVELEKIEKDPTNKKHTVQMIDVEALSACMTDAANDLYKIHKRMVRNKYRHLSELDSDVKNFNEIYEKSEARYNTIMEKEIKMSVRKAINLIEDELTGRRPLIKAMNQAIQSCEEMSRYVDQISQKRDLYGADMLPAYMSAGKRITSKFTNFIQRGVGKGISKLVGGAVFLLA